MDRSVLLAVARAAGHLGWCAIAIGCLTRPVASTHPTTKTNFTATLPNTAVTKIDLLFDIDNSASMGDKQQYLVQAIPDLVNRLLNPNCVAADGTTVTAPSVGGACDDGQTPEFNAVRDLHLGIVTSSLGSRLSGELPGAQELVCDPSVLGNDDQGHLIARGQAPEQVTAGPVQPVADAVVPSYAPSPGGFLYWYPAATPAPSGPAGLAVVTSAPSLEADFTSMVEGAGAAGCGIESQLESWYSFWSSPTLTRR